MKRHLLLSTVAIALALGTVAASAQTRRPSDQDNNVPKAGGAAQNAPTQQGQAQQGQAQQGQAQQGQGQTQPGQAQPNAKSQNAGPQQAPSATTGQAAPPQQRNAPAANNQSQQPA